MQLIHKIGYSIAIATIIYSQLSPNRQF
uniref:Uncharacterized protein n=1 Tax=Anguilla anguilla TaxID=7936 RepID=A0A0E9W4P0_ANGAN